MNLAAVERDLYDKAFAIDAYSIESPGELFAPAFLEMAAPNVGESVLDAGCGTGKGALALEACGLRPTLLDLVDARIDAAMHFPFIGAACLWRALPVQCDWAYCCDVLEHIPEEFTMLVAMRVIHAAKHGAFFSIALEPDNFGTLLGEPLHKTVRPFTWWRDHLSELGGVAACRDVLTNGLYLVEPR